MSIKRGEVWLANLDPTIGGEIRKTRPVLVVSNNANNTHNQVVSILPIRTCLNFRKGIGAFTFG